MGLRREQHRLALPSLGTSFPPPGESTKRRSLEIKEEPENLQNLLLGFPFFTQRHIQGTLGAFLHGGDHLVTQFFNLVVK